MKKLKVALVLLFTLCFSLFLFACAGEEELFQSIDLSTTKTEFTEADSEATFDSIGLSVTGNFKKGDEAISRVLVGTGDAPEYVVKADDLKAAFAALKAHDYGSARGTYEVEVTAEVGGYKRSESVTVTIDHAWNADRTACSVCGATQNTYAIDDTIEIAAWGSAAVYTANKADSVHGQVPAGEKYVSYGTIGMGQKITLKGKGYQTAGNTSTTYFFPITGIRNGAKGVVVRNDSWTILEGPGATFYWPNHTGGLDATSAAYPADANEWDIYQVGSICVTSDYGGSAEAANELEISWEYRQDGVIVFEISNITSNKTITRYMKVPNMVYDCVLYGEKFTYMLTSVTYTSNLTLEEFDVKFGENFKSKYAENTYLEIDPDSKNLNGVNATAHYNKQTSNVSTPIYTYNIYANVGDKAVDLRENPLTAEMTNFRVEFGGKTAALNLTVLPSSIKDVTTSYDFRYNGNEFFANNFMGARVEFTSDYASFKYDVSGDKVAIIGAGSPNKLAHIQKMALLDGAPYYVSFRLIGLDPLASATSNNDKVKISTVKDNGICVIVPIESATDLNKTTTLTVKSNVTAEDANGVDTVITIDLSGMKLAEVEAVVMSNETSLLEGGEVEVYYFLKTSGTADKYSYAYAGTTRDFAEVNTEAGASVGSGRKMYGTYLAYDDGDYIPTQNKTGVYRVTYTVPGLDLTGGVLSLKNQAALYSVDDTVNAIVTIDIEMNVVDGDGYPTIMDPAYYAYYANPEVFAPPAFYMYANGKTLYFIGYEDSYFLAGRGMSFSLNANEGKGSANEFGVAYDLSFTVNNNGLVMSAINKVSNNAVGVLGLNGTVGNNADGDKVALYVLSVDLAALYGIENDDYYFELVLGNGYHVYSVKDGEISDVSADLTAHTLATPSTHGSDSDCIYNGSIGYYQASMNFVYGNVSTPATGTHTWTEANGVKTCSKCGSVNYGTTVKAGSKVDKAVFANVDLVERGLTLDFDITKAYTGGDWAAKIITTSQNFIITLPNIDPWNNTSGALTGINGYPGVDPNATYLYAGATYGAFLETTCHATITLSTSTGVTFYKNGVKVIHYPANSVLGDGKTAVTTVVEVMLNDIKNNGFTFGEGLLEGDAKESCVGNLKLYTKALTLGQIAAETSGKNGYYDVSGELGNDKYEVAVFGDWVNVPVVAKGTQVTFYGTAAGEVKNAWESILFEFTTNGWWMQRADNYGWSFGAGLATVSMTPSTSNEVEDWVAEYKRIAANCTWSLNINFEENGTLTTTLIMTAPDGATYTDVCVFNFGANPVPEFVGLHFTAELSHIWILYSVTATATDTSAAE